MARILPNVQTASQFVKQDTLRDCKTINYEGVPISNHKLHCLNFPAIAESFDVYNLQLKNA